MVKLKKWKKTVATLFCAAACAWFPFSGYCPIWQVQAEEIKPSELYAQSAVLMGAVKSEAKRSKEDKSPLQVLG